MRKPVVCALMAVGLGGGVLAAEANLLANGGFEVAARMTPRRLDWLRQNAVTFDGDDPLLPGRWTLNASRADIRLVPEAHAGRQALRIATANGNACAELGMVEVVPGATYTFGAWSRGVGSGRLTVYGNAYEGRKDLARVDLALTDAWTGVRGQVTIPGNVRTVTVSVAAWSAQAVLVDDVFLTTATDVPFSADAILHEKPKADAHTLVLVDFDSPGAVRLETGATLTDENGGRFGKGLRLDRALASSAAVPLSLGQMPEQGTFEFWAAPDDEPEHIYWLAALIAGETDILHLQADTSDCLNLLWRVSAGPYDRQNTINAYWSISRGWFRRGQWLHLAVQWDTDAVRYFVNGVLVGLSTARPLPFFATPSTIKLGSLHSVYAWSGVIDEVRLSDVQRYGPVMPSGVAWTPLVVAAVARGKATETAAEPARPAPDFARERAALIGVIPPAPAGAIPFDASRMKPLVEDDGSFKFSADTPVPGLNTATIGIPLLHIGEPDLDGGYWTVEGMPAAHYYLGVWYESGKAGAEANQHYRGALVLYVNGRIAPVATTSDPVQVASGVYFAEAQSRDAVPLSPGDEVAVLCARSQPRRIARLTLYPQEPRRGHNWMPEVYHAGWFNRRTDLGLGLEATFLAAPGKGVRDQWFRLVQEADVPEDLRRSSDGTKAVAQCRIANPLPVPLTVEFRAELRAFFRELVGRDTATVVLAPHRCVTREVPFALIPDSRRYTFAATARAVDPPRLPWPEAETIRFFPGVRQNLPWPDPFSTREELAIRFTGVLPGERMQFSLSGPWNYAFTTELAPPVPAPAGLAWQSRMVPFPGYACVLDRIDPRPHGMYLRRTFTMPSTDAPKTWRLVLANAMDEAAVHVNGQKVGMVRGGNTPVVCDVTTALKPGANEILLVLRDSLALMDPAYVNPAAPVFSPQYLDAPGGGGALSVGEITLEASPLLAVGDVLILPSVRRQELSARFTVTSHEPAARTIAVSAQVLDAGVPVLELGSAGLPLAPGEVKSLSFTKHWAKPTLWGPSNPKLYCLAIAVTDPATGQRLDLLRERFGFRESWVDGGRIRFNGAPVRLKGSTCQGGGGVGTRDDVQWSRGTEIPDFMDEFGYPVSQCLAAIFNSSSRHNVERDVFWDSARGNVLAGAARQANHPCIIAWDLSNEWLSFLDYGGGDPMAGARRFKALADALTAYDPSRWIIFNGDEDLHGLHNTFSTHYMMEAANGSPTAGFEFRGHSSYFPDGAFFRPLDQDFQPGQKVCINRYRDVDYRCGEKPLLNTENLWKVSGYQPPGPSKFVDEDDVLSPGIDSGRGAVAWMWKQNLDGHRDLGCTAVCNYSTHPGVSRGGHMLQSFIMPDHTHHAFGGRALERRYSLHNDLFVPAAFVFRWELLDPQGATVRRGKDRRKMSSGDLQRGHFSLALPRVTARTTYTLRLTLEADGTFAYGEERDLEVWPERPTAPTPLARGLLLFDPNGQTAAGLAACGVTFATVSDLATVAAEPGAPPVLVIGEGALDAASAAAGTRLQPFIDAGGRVLVLAQTSLLAGLPVRTILESREWSSLPFVRTPQHPVLKGVTSWDLQFWAPDHVSARGAYSKPEGGACVPLVDSGTDAGLEWVQLLECYRGDGLYLLCQFPVVGKLGVEPMASELLNRMLGYLAGDAPFRQPRRPLEVVAGASPVLATQLQDLGVVHRVVQRETEWAADTVRLVDAAALPPSFAAPAAWHTAVAGGATLLIHGATPEQQPFLTALAGRPVRLTVQPYGMWEGRGFRNGSASPVVCSSTWLTAGLSHIDLYWKEYDGAEAAIAQAEEPRYKIEDLCWWSASAQDMAEHVFPGALVEVPVGKGRLILDQIRWETTKAKADRLATRVVSAMMGGLGVAVEPYVSPRALPAGVMYQPLDLAPFANRGFRDEVGDDGRGGWSDQGPNIDLHEFPTGRQTFGGVPFLVGAEPHCCIVLKSNARPFPELLPDEVSIPVGSAVEGLCFLHGATYCGDGPVALYQVQYADGSTQDIELVAPVNIRDWVSAPGEFAKERNTQSRVAWTGTTKVFPVVAIYQMLWVNPKPATAVRAVRFANPTRTGCPILIAVTAAVPGGAKATAGAAEAQARARESLKAGQEAFSAGRDTEAKARFEEALKTDPTLDAAYLALGQVCERLKDEDGALAAYRAWVLAGARTPLPYNKIGDILERRKDLKAALEAYTRSLQIEWNQPPAIEAKRRLENALRQ